MKKIALLLVFILAAGFVLADDLAIAQGSTPTVKEKTIIVYDPIKHTQTASTIFMTWAGVSLGGGIIASTSTNGLGRRIGTGSIIYGVIETAMAIVNINWGDKYSDPEKARLAMIDEDGWHAWTGLVHIAAGAALAVLAKSDDIKGMGVAMALQGGFISISNTMNYSIAKDPKNIRDWNAGIEVKFPLLSAAF